jgi:hypothetical protein
MPGPAGQLRLGRGLCESLAEPGLSGPFQPGRRGQEVPRSVAVERLRVRAPLGQIEAD